MWSSRTVEPSEELDVGAMAASVAAESARRRGSKPAARYEEGKNGGAGAQRRATVARKKREEAGRGRACERLLLPLLAPTYSLVRRSRGGEAWGDVGLTAPIPPRPVFIAS